MTFCNYILKVHVVRAMFKLQVHSVGVVWKHNAEMSCQCPIYVLLAG